MGNFSKKASNLDDNAWLETEYLVFNQDKYEREKNANDILGLNIESEKQYKWLATSIKLSLIVSFSEYLMSEEEESSSLTIVYFGNNSECVINIPYAVFCKEIMELI